MSDVPTQARYPRKPVDGYNDMIRRGRPNRYSRRFPNHEIDMDAVCYYSTTSGHGAESGSVRIN